jgi:PhnB protein
VRASPHLTFAGECEAAFRFYQQLFGGTGLALFRYADSPLPVAPQWRDKIVHASLTVGDTTLAGADVVAEKYQAPRGFYVLVTVGDASEAERIFGALSENGEVQMPLQKTFWSPAFGVVVDRFATPWEISCAG